MAEFATWLHTFVSEKGLDLEHRFEKDGPSGLNSIPLAIVVDAIIAAPNHEQVEIRKQIALLDFRNADILKYFDHLAGALAI